MPCHGVWWSKRLQPLRIAIHLQAGRPRGLKTVEPLRNVCLDGLVATLLRLLVRHTLPRLRYSSSFSFLMMLMPPFRSRMA